MLMCHLWLCLHVLHGRMRALLCDCLPFWCVCLLKSAYFIYLTLSKSLDVRGSVCVFWVCDCIYRLVSCAWQSLRTWLPRRHVFVTASSYVARAWLGHVSFFVAASACDACKRQHLSPWFFWERLYQSRWLRVKRSPRGRWVGDSLLD